MKRNRLTRHSRVGSRDGSAGPQPFRKKPIVSREISSGKYTDEQWDRFVPKEGAWTERKKQGVTGRTLQDNIQALRPVTTLVERRRDKETVDQGGKGGTATVSFIEVGIFRRERK